MAAYKEMLLKIGVDTGGLESGLDAGIGKLGMFAGVAATASATIVAGFAAVGVAAFQIGQDWEEATGKIRVGTGATGEALDDLKESAKTVFAGVPQSAGEVATAIADLNTRTGQTGVGLEALATQVLNLSDITGEDLAGAIAATTRVFGDWSIASDKQAEANDYLFKVSQSTGIGVTDLANKIVQFGAPLRQLGFDFETSAALMGKWEKEGVNLETVMSGMKIGLSNLAQAGMEPVEGLRQTMEAIKGAGSAAEANGLAIEVFGSRAGPDMAAAIMEGRFEIDELVSSLETSTETINSADAASETLGEKWAILTHQASLLLEPIGTGMVNALSDVVTWVMGLAGEIGTVADGFVIWLGEIRAVSPAFDVLATAFETVGGWIKILVVDHVNKLIEGFGLLKDAASSVWEFFLSKGKPANDAVAKSAAPAAKETTALDKALAAQAKAAAEAEAKARAAAAAAALLGDKADKAEPEVFNLDAALRAVEASNKALEKTAQDAAKALANELARDARIASLEIVQVSTDTQDAMLKIQGFTQTAAAEWSSLAASASMKTAEIDAAFSALGLNTITELSTMATEAEARFQTIKTSGEATPQAINTAWVDYLQKRKAAVEAAGGELTTAESNQLAALLAQQEKFKSDSTGEAGVFTSWATDVKGIVSGLSTDLVDALFPSSGGFSLSNIGTALSGIADKFKNALAQPAKDAIADLIDKGINALMGALDGVIGKLTGTGGVQSAMEAAFGAATGAGGSAAGSAGGASIPGGGGGGGGAGGGGGGALGIVNAITGIATAISSIFGNFQMAAMNATLDLIEEQTRRTAQYLGDRADGGVVGILFKTNELLSWGPMVKAVESVKDYTLSMDNWFTAWNPHVVAIKDAAASTAVSQNSSNATLAALREDMARVVDLLREIVAKDFSLNVDGQELARSVGAAQEALMSTA